MSVTMWDTTGGEVVAALSRERRAAGAVATGLALTLVVVAGEKTVVAAEEAATVAAQAHPCRLLVVVRRQVDAGERLDAEVAVGGRLGPAEAVVLRTFGRLSLHAESVVLPLLAPDAPVVVWWHGEPPAEIAADPLGVLAARRITDCARAADPLAALRQRATDFALGDTDLAWTRTTPWRALIASAFDSIAGVTGAVTVEAEAGNPSAALLAGWLSARLGVPAARTDSPGPGVTAVAIDVSGPEQTTRLEVTRPDGRMATVSRTGQPDRTLPLPRRTLGDLLAEEVRRLDPDSVYAEALAAATDVPDLAARSAGRVYVWRDPALQLASGGGTA